MAGEFDKRTEPNGTIVWTCTKCGIEIINLTKPRRHICHQNGDDLMVPHPLTSAPTTPGIQTTPQTSRTPINIPPPGFRPSNQNLQGTPQVLPWDHFMRHQQQQMEMFQEQQVQMIRRQQEVMLEQQKQQQELLLQHQKAQEVQNVETMNKMIEMLKLQKSNETRVKCPKWEKEEKVDNFLNRLKGWDEIEKGKGKYLHILEALQSSNRSKEKLRIELEVQNGTLDTSDDAVVKEITEKMKKWFGKTKVDEASESWRNFMKIKRNKNESIDDFLFRFETAESKLRQAACQIPNLILMLQLLEAVDIKSDQKQNVLVHVKTENTEQVYEDLKSSLRLLKGSLTDNHRENEEDNKNDDEEEVNFNKSEPFKSRGRSRSRGSFRTRRFSESREGSSNRRPSWERGRRPDRYNSQDRNYRRHFTKSRSKSHGRSPGQSRIYESVHLTYKENGEEAKLEVRESNNKMIVDSACTKTVAGAKWMSTYLSKLPEKERKEVVEKEDSRYFRFGDSIRYPSKREVQLPIRLGKLISSINVSVVDASVPLLLGKPDLKRFGFVINFEEETVYISRTHEIFPLETTHKGHLALSLVEENELEDEAFVLSDCKEEEKLKRIARIHKVLAHPQPRILKKFFNDSSERSPEISKMVDAVTDKCEVCRKFKKSPSKPKVSLPMSDDFNQCVALDLKELNKKYILYCVCTFTRLTRGVIIKNKLPKTIVSGIIQCWILGNGIGPGVPGKFLFDNGGEFNNPEVLDLAEKYGMKMHAVTAAHSPYSNGICEKNHEIVDRMMSKIMADDKDISENEALNHALFAKNIEPNNKGFSPFQIVYGTNPNIPGIINSTPSSLNSEFASQDVREHLTRLNKAREAFRMADNDERIKRALKAKISNANDDFFETNDQVYFKKDQNIEWSGPASVVGQQGKVVFLRYGNNLRRVHKSKVIKVGKEYSKGTDNEETEDENETKENVNQKETSVSNEGPEETSEHDLNLELETKLVPKRKSILRCPKKSRRIIFKIKEEDDWTKALVKDVANKKALNQFECTLLLDNTDEIAVDFSNGVSKWEYEKFHCDKCSKSFETRRSLRMHKTKVHENQKETSKSVHFNEVTEKEESVHVNTHCATSSEDEEIDDFKDIRKRKVRFQEIIDERSKNEMWIKSRRAEEQEDAMYLEIKENEENQEKVHEAKEKELKNFDDFDVYEEIKYKDQDVLGTRFVLTQKPDNSIKARFVVKGFQENFEDASDSPTSSRETLKVFLAVAANEKFQIKCSDVRSAFLQSNTIQRDVFIDPPPQRKKPGYVWKLKRPCYGLDDASRQWFQSFKNTLISLEMTQSKREACLFYLVINQKLHGLLIFHVDDILSAGDEVFENVMKKLREKYTFGKVETKDFVFTGIRITQNENFEVTADQEQFLKTIESTEYDGNKFEDNLDEDETKNLRSLQGKLSWLSTQTRPDLAFDAFQLSTVLNRATIKDAKNANKVVKKMKQNDIKLKFGNLGKVDDMHIEVFADASLGNIEDQIHTKSAMGYFICLANSSFQMSPLHWKSAVIEKVAEDVKTAETLALEKSIDDAVHFSNLITEIYTGESTTNSIPIVANTDSKSLLQSIYSTKKVKRKTMRVVISSIQQNLQNKIIKDVHHVKSRDNIADIFTKKGVDNTRIKEVLKFGNLGNRNYDDLQ